MRVNKLSKIPRFIIEAEVLNEVVVVTSIFNANQSINANVLLENVDFYVKEKFQFYTMIMHILEKRPKH